MKISNLSFIFVILFLTLLIGCTNDKFVEEKKVAWNYLVNQEMSDNANEDLDKASVSEVEVSDDYKLIDETYIGKTVVAVTFEDKENVVIGTPTVLVSSDNKVIGFIPSE